MGDDSVLTMEGEAVGGRIHADRRKRDHLFLVEDPVVVTERELPSRELRVPLDAMKQFLKGLHLMVSTASGSRHRRVPHQSLSSDSTVEAMIGRKIVGLSACVEVII